MEPPSALPRGGRVPWQELLLAVSLLTFWNPPTTAQVTVELVPPNAAEGKDVLLRVHNLPANLLGFGWFKGTTIDPHREIVSYAADSQEITPGLAHSGRETLYHNGSLLFQNISLEDTGYYTLQIIKRNVHVERVIGQLRVYPELPKPNIISNNPDPVENVDSVVLTCEPQTQNTSYLWSVNSKSLPDSARLELSLNNRTLTLHGVTRNDTGPYECETWNPVSAGHSDPFTLNVLYGPDAPTISPSDSYYRPGANLSLSCHSASNPPAQYSWLINGSPQPSSQELFIPNITVNDSGSYTCLVYNPGTRLSKTTVKTITVSEPVSQPSINISNTTATEHKDSVVLTCSTNNKKVSIRWFFNGRSVNLTKRMKLSQDNRALTISPVRVEDAGNYQCEVSNPVSSSKSDPVRLAVSWPVANVITERWGTQPAPLVMVQSAAPHPRTPYPARGQPFPSTRSYNTLTGTFTARSTTKDKCLLSFPFPWELLLPGAFLRPQTLGGVRCRRLSQRTSSEPRGYSGTWTQGPGLPDFWKP
ncbi:carcinoembryonic antigen-related cell adhesion molecule 6-like isoform X1 [Neofelis nebulosa]|uniref:carcinoembryonic antigen-related cell adhesion molecule 6-like isoform X1 n=1 Tax=Neofelis nebulosa TaxID=61452 RepID=UPI00272AEDB8|nr:carcinoembryonic antigen-related cell adhesion molecule 6-like isoform X1 [Neofelis nebulosa]